MQGCTPYGTTNTYIAKHTTNVSRDEMIFCNQCDSNRKNPPRALYVVTTRECVKTKTNLLEPIENGFNIAKPNLLHKTNKFSLGTNKLAHNQQVLC